MSFSRVPANHELAEINSQSVSKMKAIKLLGMHIQSDLKWNTHILETVKKATKQLFFLVQLIRAEVSECELVKFYVACIQSVLLYGCQTFHFSLLQCLSTFMEMVQKLSLKIMFGYDVPYMRMPFLVQA